MLEDRRHTQSREGVHQRAALIYCNGESFSGLCKNLNVLKLNKLFFRWFRAHIQEVQNHTRLSLFSFPFVMVLYVYLISLILIMKMDSSNA